MKKILNVLVLLLIALVLVACGNGAQIPKAKGEELSAEKTQAFLSSVDLATILSPDLENQSYLQTSNLEFDLNVNAKDADNNEATIKADGKFESKVHVTSGQNINSVLGLLELKGSGRFEFEAIAGVETFDDRNISASTNIDFNAYIKEAAVYLNGELGVTLKQDSVEVSASPKIDKSKISDLDLSDLVDLTNSDVPGFTDMPSLSDIPFDELEEFLSIKVYQDKDDHQIFLKLDKTHLKNIVETVFGFNIGEGNSDFSTEVDKILQGVKTFEVEIYVELKGANNTISKLVSNVNIEIDYQGVIPSDLIQSGVDLNTTLTFKFKASSETDFNAKAVSLPSLNNYKDAKAEDVLAEFYKLNTIFS